MKKSKAKYPAYVKSYGTQQDKLLKKGLSMRSPMLSQREFEAVYAATRNDLAQDVKMGKRKVIGNVTQNIVRSQAYSYSPKQAKAMMKAAEVTGQKLSYTQIRAGQFDWTQINQSYMNMLEKGMSMAAIADDLGKTFFGS